MKRPIHVLLVDDEERFLTTAGTTLKNRNFEVDTAADASEALKKVREGDIDVVVLDVKMPGMDGNEVLRRIKTLKPDLEVIMLTGHGTVESAFAGWRDDVFAYLTKPCDIDVLAEKITDAHGKKKGIDSSVWYSAWSREKAID